MSRLDPMWNSISCGREIERDRDIERDVFVKKTFPLGEREGERDIEIETKRD